MKEKMICLKIIFIFLLTFNQLGKVLCKNDCETKNAKIIIVGAGPSGIAAASKLLENGFHDVTILEAENRIGGRVYSTKFGNYSVDMGGQWVHGQEDNVAYKLAEPLDLLEYTNASDFGIHQVLINSDGNKINDELAKNLTTFFFEYADGMDNINGSIYKSLGAFVEKTFEEKFKDNPEILNEKEKYLMYLELSSIGSWAAQSWHDLSVSEDDKYREYKGDLITNWKERTYGTILDILMKRYPDPKQELPVLANTILDSEVTSINYTQGEGPSKISVITSSGKSYDADHVIVTVSLGVLKANYKSLFTPALPEYKIKTIESLGYGVGGKVYLMFDKPFWDLEDWKFLSFSFLWNEQDKKVLAADPEKMWVLGLMAAFTVEHKPNLLELWISGNYSKAMEALPENKVFNHSVELIHRFMGKKYNITKPIAMLRTQWFTNPHFRGIYSYRSMKTVEDNVNAEMLERPLTPDHLKVLFAGEATSSDRYATVDGAIGSGWKAANRLIDYYAKEC